MFVGDRCIRTGCEERLSPAAVSLIKRSVQRVCRMAFLIICSMSVGVFLTMYVHAQVSTLPERTARLEEKNIDLVVRVAKLESDEAHTETEVATMNGIGIGLGSALGLLQIVQMMLSRHKEA